YRRRRALIVEVHLRIREIRQDENLVLFRERDQILVEIEVGDVSRRIGWITDDEGQRLRDRMDDGALDGFKELRRRLRGYRADHAAGHQKPEGVDRIARVRTQHDVARRGNG